jgi:hypothetical protein
VRHLEGALRKCDDVEFTTWNVLSSIQPSGALAERRSKGDAGRSRLLAEQVMTLARELGLGRAELGSIRG